MNKDVNKGMLKKEFLFIKVMLIRTYSSAP